jgi:hypothetical protein
MFTTYEIRDAMTSRAPRCWVRTTEGGKFWTLRLHLDTHARFTTMSPYIIFLCFTDKLIFLEHIFTFTFYGYQRTDLADHTSMTNLGHVSEACSELHCTKFVYITRLFKDLKQIINFDFWRIFLLTFIFGHTLNTNTTTRFTTRINHVSEACNQSRIRRHNTFWIFIFSA